MRRAELLDSELPADALPFVLAECGVPAARGYLIARLQRNARETLDRCSLHEFVQHVDHAGQQLIEQDAGFEMQPVLYQVDKSPGVPAAEVISRLQYLSAVGAGQSDECPFPTASTTGLDLHDLEAETPPEVTPACLALVGAAPG